MGYVLAVLVSALCLSAICVEAHEDLNEGRELLDFRNFRSSKRSKPSVDVKEWKVVAAKGNGVAYVDNYGEAHATDKTAWAGVDSKAVAGSYGYGSGAAAISGTKASADSGRKLMEWRRKYSKSKPTAKSTTIIEGATYGNGYISAKSVGGAYADGKSASAGASSKAEAFSWDRGSAEVRTGAKSEAQSGK